MDRFHLGRIGEKIIFPLLKELMQRYKNECITKFLPQHLEYLVFTLGIPVSFELIICKNEERKNIEFFINGMMLDGTSRLRDKNGHMVRHGNFVSGFSSHSVVPEDGAILLPKEIPLDQACLMGCCVPTGWRT